MGHLLDLANAGIAAADAAEAAARREIAAEGRHRHWWIHYLNREPVEVIFEPGIKHKTVLLVYPKAIAAEPIVDRMDV